jgi:hypothetical protein
MSTKQAVLALLEKLPGDCTMDDIQYISMSSDHRARQAGHRAREEAEPRRREARAKGQVAKQREVIWTAGARTDLDEIVAYIAKDSPTAALASLEEVSPPPRVS